MATNETVVNIEVGTRRIQTTMDLALILGFEHPYTNDESKKAQGYKGRIDLIATALSEGLDGEAAILRAIALLTHLVAETAKHKQSISAHEAKAIADTELHTARVLRQAAQLECRAHGKSEKID